MNVKQLSLDVERWKANSDFLSQSTLFTDLWTYLYCEQLC